MQVKIEIDAKEVEEIITAHVARNVLYHYAEGMVIHVRGSSYSGLSATVTIEDAPVDESKKEN